MQTMKFNWKVRSQEAYQPSSLNIPTYLDRILSGRGLVTDEEKRAFLEPNTIPFPSPYKLCGMDDGIQRMIHAKEKQEKVCIIGDYDLDGITSTAILSKTLTELEIDHTYLIPHRVKEGYGFQTQHITRAQEMGAQVILTCDNGIQSFEAVDVASDAGIDVIITDHHLPKHEDEKDVLPDAIAVLNPHRIDCDYPSKTLSGAGVSLKFAQALWQALRQDKMPPILFGYAALGTIGDVMQVMGENRRLIQIGLHALNAHPSEGIRALRQALKIKGPITEHEIGFQIAPCLNAAGRLDDAMHACALLLTDDPEEALEIANALVALNMKRKTLTEDAFDDALSRIQDGDQQRIVLLLNDCHESLLGIVAGRLKDKFQKDAYVFTESNEEGYLKASARGMGHHSMVEDLRAVEDLLVQFGGHNSAAGLTLKTENFDAFRRQMEWELPTHAPEKEELLIDYPMDIRYASDTMATQIEVMKPHGNGNQQPIFASKNVNLIGLKVLGKNKNTLQYIFASGNQQFKGIQFRGVEETLRYLYKTYDKRVEEIFDRKGDGFEIDICYHLVMNEFAGRKSLQLQIVDIR